MTHHRRAIGGRSTTERVPHVALHLRRHCELLWRKKWVQQRDTVLWCGVSVGVLHAKKLRTFSKSMIRCTSGCTMVMEIQRLRFSVHSGIDRARPNVSIASSSPICAAAVGPVRTAGRGDGRYLLAEGDCVVCTASVLVVGVCDVYSPSHL